MHKIRLILVCLVFSMWSYPQEHTIKVNPHHTLIVELNQDKEQSAKMFQEVGNTRWVKKSIVVPDKEVYNIYTSFPSVLLLYLPTKKLILKPAKKVEGCAGSQSINLSEGNYPEVAIIKPNNLTISTIKKGDAVYIDNLVLGKINNNSNKSQKSFSQVISNIDIGSLSVCNNNLCSDSSNSYHIRDSTFASKGEIVLEDSNAPYELTLRNITTAIIPTLLFILYSSKNDPNTPFYTIPIELVKDICSYARKLGITTNCSKGGNFEYYRGDQDGMKAPSPTKPLIGNLTLLDYPPKGSFLVVKYTPQYFERHLKSTKPPCSKQLFEEEYL